MKKTLLALMTLSALGTSAMAEDYKIDPAHSFVQFKVQHLGYSWLLGSFNEVAGNINYDADNAQNNQININVATASLDTNHKVRDGHLSTDTTINSKAFPTASFVSTSYVGDNESGLVTGKLSINGVEKEVSLDVNKIGEGSDPWGGYRVGFEGELSFDRRDFASDMNLGPASWEVNLEVYLEAIKQ